MTRRRSSFALVAVWGAGLLLVTAPAQAQQGPADPGATGQGGGASAGSGTVINTTYGVVAPPPPGQPLGGGNATESSSRARSGDNEDSFDLAPGGADSASGANGGGGNGAVFFASPEQARPMGPPPATHTVVKGDTLWSICDQTFRNPYEWPKIWSYNPQIQNPHWIYPNEQLRLKPSVPLTAKPNMAMPEEGPGMAGLAPSRVAPDTVFLRDEGFVNDDASLNWGAIVGSPQDKMYLTDFDEVYVRVASEHDVKIGQELTVFRPIRKVGDGQVIAIQGTLRVDDWNPQSRIAQARVIETLDAIERGARVGPVTRKFEVVPPKRNDADVTAHVAVAVQPHVVYGQNQVVFIDQGADAGLQVGNRLLVVRHGDAWRKSMVTDQTARRIMGEREEPAAIENTPSVRNDSALPEDVVAELRVLGTQKTSATCLVTQSRREIEPGDVAIARKGY
ncbi:MAG TPA: LysM peptidoglycan-binding domain-containing protein [Polyangiaceae bacterium]|jgi:hypothetical protein